MIRKIKKFLYIMVLLLELLLPLLIRGQEFVSDTNFSGVVGSGARAFAMGGAFIAIADDATAASWNPGGLGQLDRPEFSFVLRQQNYRRIEPAFSDMQSFTGPKDMDGSAYGFDFVSFTYPFRIGDFKIVPQISYQRAINYHLETKMNNVITTTSEYIPDLKSLTEFKGATTQTDKFTGGIDTVSFSIGTRIFKRINIGFSANFWINGFKGEETLFNFGKLYRAEDSGFITDVRYTDYAFVSVDVSGFNFNVGVLLDVLDNLKIGAVYKSSATADVDYEADVRFQGITGALSQETREFQVSETTTMTWPETWGAGISYRPIDTLTLSLDYTKTNWSQSIIKNFKHRGEGFAEVAQDDLYFPSFLPVDNEFGLKQLDTRQVRFGLEYVLIGKKILIPLRLGFFTDSQYFHDASGEKVNFIGVTGGAGIKKGGLGIDVAVLYESGRFLRTNFDFSVTQFTDLRFYVSTTYSF